MKRLFMLAAFAMSIASPAFANDRTLTVTEFDRLRVEGSFIVEVVTGRGVSGRISGSEQAIERTRVEVQGQTLFIHPNRSAWGGWEGQDAGPTIIQLTTPALRAAWSSGGSTIKIDRMRAPSISLSQEGSGSLGVAAIETDRLDIGMAGAGTVKIAGKVADTHAIVRGSGSFDASALASSDVRLTTDGAAEVRIAAIRTANVIAAGSGSVAILGKPACTVRNRGSGTVACTGVRPQ